MSAHAQAVPMEKRRANCSVMHVVQNHCIKLRKQARMRTYMKIHGALYVCLFIHEIADHTNKLRKSMLRSLRELYVAHESVNNSFELRAAVAGSLRGLHAHFLEARPLSKERPHPSMLASVRTSKRYLAYQIPACDNMCTICKFVCINAHTCSLN